MTTRHSESWFVFVRPPSVAPMPWSPVGDFRYRLCRTDSQHLTGRRQRPAGQARGRQRRIGTPPNVRVGKAPASRDRRARRISGSAARRSGWCSAPPPGVSPANSAEPRRRAPRMRRIRPTRRFVDTGGGQRHSAHRPAAPIAPSGNAPCSGERLRELGVDRQKIVR